MPGQVALPFFSAFSLMETTSEPALGSLMARAPMNSPLMSYSENQNRSHQDWEVPCNSSSQELPLPGHVQTAKYLPGLTATVLGIGSKVSHMLSKEFTTEPPLTL